MSRRLQFLHRLLASFVLSSACVDEGAVAQELAAAAAVDCAQFKIKDTDSKALQDVGQSPQACRARNSHGMPLPDASCTPGALNPTITSEILRNPAFRTSCVRGHATTEEQKATTYGTYGIPHPAHNNGVMQVCELDHLVSLELGGADTLDNIWPQCGPDRVALVHRFFKEKDTVENFLAKQVRDGVMDLADVQKKIAADWTQFLPEAQRACPAGKCK
jgi:hypothetical protein